MCLICSACEQGAGPHPLTPSGTQLESDVGRLKSIGCQNSEDGFRVSYLISESFRRVLPNWQTVWSNRCCSDITSPHIEDCGNAVDQRSYDRFVTMSMTDEYLRPTKAMQLA